MFKTPFINKALALSCLPWLLLALALVAAPLGWDSGLARSMLSQMGYVIIICLSYNVLLGQGGMLSFGHAVFTGLGAFVTIHAIGGAGGGTLALPLPLMPLLGGVAGGLLAALLGLVATQKSGTTFAMITLGMGELVAAVALMLPQFFGGEGGISADRVYGTPWWGWSFGPALQVYYLIAAYCLVCVALLYAFTTTPLGRLLNAVRDCPERVAFIGYSPQRVRYLAFIVAGFFAGIGGALAAIHLEIVTTADSVSLLRSGNYLLFTFLGGAGFFFGPVLGAVLLVLATVWFSALTPAWLLYLGLLFVLLVMYAPGGLAGVLLAGWQQWRGGTIAWRRWAGGALALAWLWLGFSALVELLYHRLLDASGNPWLRLYGWQCNSQQPQCWALALGVLASGALGLWWLRRGAQGAP